MKRKRPDQGLLFAEEDDAQMQARQGPYRDVGPVAPREQRTAPERTGLAVAPVDGSARTQAGTLPDTGQAVADRPAARISPPPVHQEQRPEWVGWYAGLNGWIVATAGESVTDCLLTLLRAGVGLSRCLVLPRWCDPERRGQWQIADSVRDQEGWALPLYVVWASSFERGPCWVEAATAHGQSAADEAVRRLKSDSWWRRALWAPVGRNPEELDQDRQRIEDKLKGAT